MRKHEANPRQLSLDDLLNDGNLHKVIIEPEEIGGETLAILTKGLYTNPMDCIREYIQNAVDAGADVIKIKITGNSVLILDNGSGMNLNDLLQSRQFGLSYKHIDEHVGFRGIGIYSGFDLCQSLRITTTKKEDPRQHVLVFNFAEMKAQLERDRNANSGKTKTSLISLLSDHTYIKREPSNVPTSRSFTQVELQNINDFHIKQLSNREELKMYLLRNLPIDFAEGFKHKKTINQHLLNNVPGFRPVKIVLESDELEDEIVDKYAGIDVQEPIFGIITHGSMQIAYYWACMTAKPELIEKNVQHEDKKYAGFVYKVKGFTVGDRKNLEFAFDKRKQMYPWYTGEVYVLDPNVVPNAERNDFEAGAAKQSLQWSFRKEVENNLLPSVLKFQAEQRAIDVFNRQQEKMANISDWLAGNERAAKSKAYSNEMEVYSDLQKIIDDLSEQKKAISADKRKEFDEIHESAKRLQKQLVKDLDNATPQSTRQRREVKKEPKPAFKPKVVDEPKPPLPPKTLETILTDAGWLLQGEFASFVNIMQSSLEDVLTTSSYSYRSLLEQVEAKLSDSSQE